MNNILITQTTIDIYKVLQQYHVHFIVKNIFFCI